MNRKVKDDVDPRSKMDKALNGLFNQVKKNMEKFVDMTRQGQTG